MITDDERARIHARASVLEQVPSYGVAITGADPFLLADHVVYVLPEGLVLVGYPLEGDFDEARLEKTLEHALARFRPRFVAVAAPLVPSRLRGGEQDPPDAYYRLALADRTVLPKVRNMLRRAGRELEVRVGRSFGRAHRRLVRAFLGERELGEDVRFVFGRIGAYAASPTVRLYEARDGRGRLVAFDLVETAARDYAFYAFNFRSRRRAVPGASDLLLARAIEDARREGKVWLGLGLGINEGVRFFKTKWGGTPYLRHTGARSGSGDFLPPL